MSVNDIIRKFNNILKIAITPQTYTVAPGDTFALIAKNTPSMTVDDLLQANPGVDPKKLKPGQVINIPEIKSLEHETAQFKDEVVTTADFEKLIADVSASVGIPTNILRGLIAVESRGNPTAKSKRGASGLTQITPDIAKKLRITNPFDVKQSVLGGAKWLKKAYQEAGNLKNTPKTSDEDRWGYALMIYHAGGPAVQKWLNSGSPENGFGEVGEFTIKYPKTVMSRASAPDAFSGWPT